MSGTHKTIFFLTALFVFIAAWLGFHSVFVKIQLSFTACFYVCYLAALVVQALIKNLYYTKKLKKRLILKHFAAAMAPGDWIASTFLPLAALLFPAAMLGSRDYLIQNALYFFLLLLIIVILEQICNDPLTIYLTNEGICITGCDFRPECPTLFHFSNGVGWHPYERIDGFTQKNKTLLIRSGYDASVIKLKAPSEEIAAVASLLKANQIQAR